MELSVRCVTPDDVLFSQIRANCTTHKKWLKNAPAHDGHAVLVGGGPSLRRTFTEIAKRQEHGQTIFGLNGAAGFLNAHGIKPDYQVFLDPQAHLIDLVAPAGAYLAASQCHPSLLAALPDPTLWHLAVDGAEQQIPEHTADFCLVGGGLTVGLSSMCLAYAMGFRKLHLYGYDSSAAGDGDHAYPSHVNGAAFQADNSLSVTIDGQEFKTTPAFAAQAKQFPKLCNDLLDSGCLITVNCDGLMKAVMQSIRSQHQIA